MSQDFFCNCLLLGCEKLFFFLSLSLTLDRFFPTLFAATAIAKYVHHIPCIGLLHYDTLCPSNSLHLRVSTGQICSVHPKLDLCQAACLTTFGPAPGNELVLRRETCESKKAIFISNISLLYRLFIRCYESCVLNIECIMYVFKCNNVMYI